MFRTNFLNKELPKYRKAITEFKAKTGSNRFYITNQATDSNGRIMPDCSALYDNDNSDTSLFWQIFDNTNIVTFVEMCENMQFYMEYCQKNGYVTPMDWIENHKHF